jgi:hypothetical protein
MFVGYFGFRMFDFGFGDQVKIYLNPKSNIRNYLLSKAKNPKS